MTSGYIHKMTSGFSGNSNHCRDVALQRLSLHHPHCNVWQQRLAATSRATLVLQRTSLYSVKDKKVNFQMGFAPSLRLPLRTTVKF